MNELNRVLILRLQRKQFPAENVETYITYRGNKLDLNENQVNEILSKIPDIWNSDKDKLIYFVLFEDKTFLCQRKKEVYNYNSKSIEQKTYYFNGVKDSELQNLVDILVDYFVNSKISEVNNFYENVIESISDFSLFKQNILQIRATELQSSDYMFNSDYTFKSEEEKQKWINYRQEWRDITEKPFWVENNFEDMILPISPAPKDQFFQLRYILFNNLSSISSYSPDNFIDDMQEFINKSGYETLLQKFTPVSIKLSILQSLNDLKVPVGFDLSEITSSYSSFLVENFDVNSFSDEIDADTENISIVEKYIKNIDSKIEKINSVFRQYDIDYTIGDIINKIFEDMKKKSEEQDSVAQAREIIEDIMMEGEI